MIFRDFETHLVPNIMGVFPENNEHKIPQINHHFSREKSCEFLYKRGNILNMKKGHLSMLSLLKGI